MPHAAPEPAAFEPRGPHAVEHRDVEYARPAGVPLLARVYRPVGVPGPLPALIDVHGGAWSHFDRTADAYFDRALAACGMVVVALDFRQGKEGRYPLGMADITAGIRSRRDEPPDARRDRFFRPEHLIAAHEMFFADEAAMSRASAQRIVEAGEFERLPPLWIAHPELDENVTLEMTERFVAAYRRAGGEVELEVFAGVGHSFANVPGEAAERCIARMRGFIARQLARVRKAG